MTVKILLNNMTTRIGRFPYTKTDFALMGKICRENEDEKILSKLDILAGDILLCDPPKQLLMLLNNDKKVKIDIDGMVTNLEFK